MGRLIIMIINLLLFTVTFSEEISIYFNKLGDNLYKDLYIEFLETSKICNENVTQEIDKKNLNIFNKNGTNDSLINILSNGYSVTEVTCLALLLNNPSCKIKEIEERQKIISILKKNDYFSDIYELKNKFLDYEQIFLKTILYLQDYNNMSNENICLNLLSIKYFLNLIKEIYCVVISNDVLYEIFSKYITNISKLVEYDNYGNIFSKTLKYFYNKKIKNKKICFFRSSKIELLNNIYTYRKWLIDALFEYSIISVFIKISKLRIKYSFAKLLNHKDYDTPYLKIKNMKNILNRIVINDTFTLKLDKTGSVVIMNLDNLFNNQFTTKILFLNIYLSQIFGITFSSAFEFTIFNKIYTHKYKIV